MLIVTFSLSQFSNARVTIFSLVYTHKVMGNLLCCNIDRKSIEKPKIVHLLDDSDSIVKRFDSVSIANTPRSRNIAFHNHIPEDNECLLLPSSMLPNRLRTINVNRICSDITVLFCKSETEGSNVYDVQEKHNLNRSHPTVTPLCHGDLIVQCGPINQSVSKVHIIS